MLHKKINRIVLNPRHARQTNMIGRRDQMLAFMPLRAANAITAKKKTVSILISPCTPDENRQQRV